MEREGVRELSRLGRGAMDHSIMDGERGTAMLSRAAVKVFSGGFGNGRDRGRCEECQKWHEGGRGGKGKAVEGGRDQNREMIWEREGGSEGLGERLRETT